MTEYQIAVQRACPKCPIGEPGCRDVCPVFRRELNKARKEKGVEKQKRKRSGGLKAQREEEDRKVATAVVVEAQKIHSMVGGRTINIVPEKKGKRK